MNNPGKIKLKKKGGNNKLASTVLFVLIFLLSISTIITIQLRSDRRNKQNMQQSAQTSADNYQYEYEKYDTEPTQNEQNSSVSQAAAQTAAEADDAEPSEQPAVTNHTEEISFVVPVDGSIIKSYSETQLVYSATMDDWRQHFGTDIECDIGDIVLCMADGTVHSIYEDAELGSTVVVSHDNGIITRYSCIEVSDGITEGAKVDCGMTLGMIASNPPCELSDNIHLHIEAAKNDVRINPMSLIK